VSWLSLLLLLVGVVPVVVVDSGGDWDDAFGDGGFGGMLPEDDRALVVHEEDTSKSNPMDRFMRII